MDWTPVTANKIGKQQFEIFETFENAMVRWRKRDGTMVKTQWYDGESVMVRW
jgi:hypothetical protein